jgi:hypothetical protein
MYSRLDRQDESRLAPLLRRLRELPAEERPPYDWVEFNERATRSRSAAAARVDWRHATVAAGAALAIIAVAMWTRLIEPDSAARIAHTDAAAVSDLSDPSAKPHWLRPDVAAGWLESLPPEPAIVRVDTHLGVTDLEDSIAWVDELITIERTGDAEPGRVMALQRERSRLVDSLARVRYAETLAAELP